MKRYISKFSEMSLKDVAKYVARVQAASDADFKKNFKKSYDMGWTNVYGIKETPMWYKIFFTTEGGKGQTSIFAFVDRETGDIYKPAGAKAPAKGIRGNIFDTMPPLSSRELYKR